MKWGFTFSIFLALFAPFGVYAQESLHTERLDISFQDNGNWTLTDRLVGITWHGEWINNQLMRVTGSDNTCFVIGENSHGMVQLDCENLKEISVLLANDSFD